MKITCAAFVILILALHCLASDDSSFTLTNRATGFCLVKRHEACFEMRWTTGDRLLFHWIDKCLGVQGKSVGSEIGLYDCDEKSELQKWECKNGTALALKGQELYIELTADNTAVLSRTIGPNSHLTILGTSSGACARTYRELYTLEGNAYGRSCMFPFLYKDVWYSSCTTTDTADNRLWCAVETKYENELWGYCPINSKERWTKHITGASYQLNLQSALTWPQAETSCRQQSASLLSITDPHQKAYVMALLGQADRGQGDKLWTGLTLDSEHGWQWTNGKPYRYLDWDSGHPLSYPGHNCGFMDGAVQYSWQSSACTKKLGYICYSDAVVAIPTEAAETGFCSRPWIPYNGHCFYLNRAQKTWSDAQKECRKEGGDLVSIHNVEDHSFVISQLGYASTDELWIGLNDIRTERLFDWSDHSAVTFTSWEYGKPAVTTGQEDCVLIKGENGNWADRVCNEKHGFICMKRSASEPSGDEAEQNVGCKLGWKRHGSYCYFVGTETKTFDEAKDDCKSSESYLADVSNGVDNAFLVSLVGLRPEKHFWLGLSNQKHIDVFVWTNTDSVRFTHWNAEMPGHQQGCVAMTTGIFAGLWDVLPCTNREKYICKHQAEGAPLTPAPPPVAPNQCAEGWSPVASRNYCFKIHLPGSSNKKTWFEARDYCRAIGGDLLSIHSHAEQQLGERRYETVWIGLSAPDPVNGYVWSDGSPANFQHWSEGEPNNKNNVESCTELLLANSGRAGSWNDNQCEKYNGWVCQIRSGVTPNPPPDPVKPVQTTGYNKTSDGWIKWKGNQYYINQKSMAMEDARHFCQRRHGDLVTIDSEAESVFLWKQISRTYGNYWIGLSVDLDGTFEWMDGSPVVFQRWAIGQPDLKNFETCAVMTTHTGFWHDYNCGHEHRSICKRNGSPAVNTTAPPTEAPKGGCPPQWKKFESKCYRIIHDQKLTQDQAWKQCKASGGDLVSISSRHEEVFLLSQIAGTTSPTSDLWIGLHSMNGYAFFWTNGRPRKYVNFGKRSRPYRRLYDFYDGERSVLSRRYPGLYLIDFEPQCVVISTNPSTGTGKWQATSCNDTNGFICLRNVDPSFPDSPELTTPPDYVRIFNDSVKAVTQQLNWDAAKKHCEADGAQLISLRNEWLQTYVELLGLNLKAPLWIGMNKKETNGYFRYIDGWHMSLSHWGQNEPSRDKPCVYIDVDGKWKTAACNQTMNSACMKSTDIPPTESPGFPGVCPEDPDTSNTGRNFFWIPFKGHCYVFFTEEKRWPDASASCARHGGSLASIEDPSEQGFIQNKSRLFQDSHDSFWIGLFKNNKGQWLWWDKTVMDFTNWGEYQPADQKFGEITTSDGTWKATSYYYNRPYICKTPKVSPPTTSPPLPSVLQAKGRGHVILAVTIVITGIVMGTVIAFFLFKKNRHRLPIPARLTAFDNPLFFSNEQPHRDVVDSKILVHNAEEENPEPAVVTM